MNHMNHSRSGKASSSGRQRNPNQPSYQSVLGGNSQQEYWFQQSSHSAKASSSGSQGNQSSNYLNRHSQEYSSQQSSHSAKATTSGRQEYQNSQPHSARGTSGRQGNQFPQHSQQEYSSQNRGSQDQFPLSQIQSGSNQDIFSSQSNPEQDGNQNIQNIVVYAVAQLFKSSDFKKLVKNAVQAPLTEPLQLTKNISRSGVNTEELEIKRNICKKLENVDIEKDLSKNASPMILNEIRF